MVISPIPRQALHQVRAFLQQAGVEDAAFDAACLMEFVAGSQWRWAVDALDSQQQEQLARLAQRRAERYPLQYLLGSWSFLDFNLKVGPGVLIPRPETELLCQLGAQALEQVSHPQVLDLCAGSGCVGLGIKRLVPDAQVRCLEKSEQALEYLRYNASHALPEGEVEVFQGDVFTWQQQIAAHSVDLIVSNPPYISHQEMAHLEPELAHEPNMALEAPAEGLAFYQHIVPAYRHCLKPGGWLMVELGWKQGPAVQNLFEQAGYQQAKICQDEGQRDRVVLGQVPCTG